MQLPIVKPAPIVKTHADSFRHLFENQWQGTALPELFNGLDGSREQK